VPADSGLRKRTVARRGILPGEYVRNLESHREASRRYDRKRRRTRSARTWKKTHSEPSSTRFFCKSCGAEFSSPEALGAHWRAEHPEIFSEDWYSRPWRRRKIRRSGPQRCPWCGREFKNPKALGAHRRYCRQHEGEEATDG